MNKELLLSLLEEEYEALEAEYSEKRSMEYTEEDLEDIQYEMTIIEELIDFTKARYK